MNIIIHTKQKTFTLLPSVIGLVGANGAGKTTFFRTLLGFIKTPCFHFELSEAVQWGWLSQEAKYFPEMPVIEVLKMATEDSQLNSQDREFLIAGFEISTLLKKNLCNLSGGEKQKVFLARVFLQKAGWLLLDEPTSFLDLKAEKFLSRAIQWRFEKYGTGIITASHQLDWLMLNVSSVIAMKNMEVVGVVDPCKLSSLEFKRNIFAILD